MRASFFALLLLFIPGLLAAQFGALDPTFGDGGLVRTPYEAGHYAEGTDIVLQPDGKILVSGTVIDTVDRMAVFRYLSNGVLDATFGNNGIALLPNPSIGSAGLVIALQTDGKIIVAGQNTIPGQTQSDLTVVRFLPNGKVDPAFGTGGLTMVDMWGDLEVPIDIAIQTDGSIVVVGLALETAIAHHPIIVRFKPNGFLDASFGDGGIVIPACGTHFAWASSVALLDDGKIVVGATYIHTPDTYSEDVMLLRFLPDGSPDPSFGEDGISRYDFGDYERTGSIAIQSDGKIVVTGPTHTNKPVFGISRFESNGNVDFNFGDSGRVVTPFYNFVSSTSRLALQVDGKIVVAGVTYGTDTLTGHDFALLRLRTDGSLDATFGDEGKVITNFGVSANDLAQSIAIQPDNKIVVVGYSYTGQANTVALARYLSNYEPPPFDTSARDNLFRLYPNPTAGALTLEFGLSHETMVSLDLYDVLGRLIQHLWSPETRPMGAFKELVTLDATVPAGAYFLAFTKNDERRYLSVVKQ